MTGTPLVALRGGVLLLTRDGSSAAADAVRAHASSLSHGYVLGGAASVSEASRAALEEAAG